MRIALADHYENPRLALALVLTENPDFELVGEAADAQGLLALVGDCPPDLILLDAELPGSPIGELISVLHAFLPRPVICIMSSDFARGRLLLNAGADTFVSKVDDPAWLVEKLREYAWQITNNGCSEKQET